IRDYASRTFFRHYAMYAFMYAQWEDLSVTRVDEGVVPKVPTPVRLHRDLEIDPNDVPELQDFLRGLEAVDETPAVAAAPSRADSGRNKVVPATKR
ncbi:unnamed protein product, partial [Polarella glacialis]